MRQAITVVAVLSIICTLLPVEGQLQRWATTSPSATEIGYVSGVTSAIQTQLDAKVSATAGTVINTVASAGLLAVDSTKTNGIAATSGHVTSALGYTPVNKAGDTMSGTLTVTGLTVTNAGAAKSYSINNGSWYTSAVPYFRSDVTNTSGILDVLAHGTGVDSWIDIGSDYVTQNPAGEFIEIRKVDSDYGSVTVKGLGGSPARNLVLQRPGVSATGKIGMFWNPTGGSAAAVHGKLDQNSILSFVMENASGSSGAYTTIEARNGTSDLEYMRIGTLGTGWSSNGGFLQDGGILESGPSIGNGISVITRNASAGFRVYTGGFADANKRLDISASGAVQVTGSLAHSIATGTGVTLGVTNEVYAVNVDAQTVTLPTAVGISGRAYTIKCIAPATSGTVATTSSETIDGSTTYSLSASNKFVRVISDNAKWLIIGNN